MSAALLALSQGAGVQGTALALLVAEGKLPKPGASIFADTRWEPTAVYAQVERIERLLASVGVASYRVSRGNLREDHLNPERPFSSMPLFVHGSDGREAMGRRQCTHEYKLVPVRRKIRELLGYPHPQRLPRGLYADVWVGFTTDEVHRINDGQSPKYARLTYPLIDLGMSRRDCERFIARHGWTAVKSACIGCPFHGNRTWREMRDERPHEWADAVAFDSAIRTAPKGSRSMIRSEQFLHRSLLPLAQAPIDRVTPKEWKERQGNIFDVMEDGDPDGCSPFGCRSGLPIGAAS